jgi:hypothetical protein
MPFTNRDLYDGIRSLRARWAAEQPPLNDYLRSLWQIARAHADAPPTAARLLDWCTAAFSTPPPDFDPAWLELKWASWDEDHASFADWERLICYQIADLQRMADDGTLSQPDRYFGVTSPSGARWYNFDPLGYLECGIRGTFGGYLASEVIVLIPSASGSDDSAVFELPPLTWADLCQLLEYGQEYE